MSNKPRDFKKELHGILDGLADHLESAPGQELVEDVRASGEDPSETASRVKRALLRSVTDFEQRKLRAARQAYEQRLAAMEEKRAYVLPGTAAGRREQLYAVLSMKPEMGQALTTRYRDFSEMTDEDVESALRELAELGVLGDLGLKNDE